MIRSMTTGLDSRIVSLYRTLQLFYCRAYSPHTPRASVSIMGFFFVLFFNVILRIESRALNILASALTLSYILNPLKNFFWQQNFTKLPQLTLNL